MNIKTSLDELSKQLQNNFPETQNSNNFSANKDISNIDNQINDNNTTKPKPYKDELNSI